MYSWGLGGKSISNVLPGMTIQFSKWASCHN